MTRFGKFCVLALCAVLALACFVGLVACNNTPVAPVDPAPDDPVDPQAPTYEVLVANYSTSQGEVAVSAPSSGDRYAQNEQVTVTVTPKLGYEVTRFAVDGYPDAALTDGVYRFAITQDVVVSVRFGVIADYNIVAEDVVSLLTGSVMFDATMIERNLQTLESATSTYRAYFDVTSQVSVFENIYLGEVASYLLLTNQNGKVAFVFHDEFGKLQLTEGEDDYADFDNPFLGLTPDDLSYQQDFTWKIENEQLRNDIIATITTWIENVTDFELQVADGALIMHAKCLQTIADEEGDQTIERDYYIETAALADGVYADKVADYEETPQHQALAQALQNAADATSYTVHYHSEEQGYDDVDGNIYFTPDGIYEDTPGWEVGYVTRPDGNVWEFCVDEDAPSGFCFLEDFHKNVTIADLGAEFVVQQASLSLLQYQGNGVFAMRFEDTVMDGYYSLFPGYFAQYFATGLDQPRYFSTAISFEIELRDNVLYRVHFVYDYYGEIREDVTLIFDNWNSTQLPITLSDEFVNGTIDGNYCGNWADDSFAYAMTVTPDSVRLNGDPAENITPTAKGYSFTAGGRSYQMTLDGDTLVLTFGGSAAYLHQTQTPWLDFLGVYSGVDGADTPYSVVIGESTLTLFVGGSVTTIGEFEYGFEFSREYETYIYTFDFTYNGAHAFLYLNANMTNTFVYGEDHDDDAEDKTVVLTITQCRWEKFLGAFEGVKNGVTYRAVVAPYGVYLFDGDGTMYVAQNIEYNSYEGFTFDVEGAEDSLCLGQNGYTEEIRSVGLYFEHSMHRNVEMDRVTAGGMVHPTDELFTPEFWGTWVSEDGSVTMVITANSLTINGEEIAATYDGMRGYQIKWGIYVAMELATWKGDGWLVINDADVQIEMYFQKSA